MMNVAKISQLKEKIDGILLVNKARGPSSNTILQCVKRLLGAKKAGHTGSLDPMATGMLPICFGEATKCSQYLLDADKVYLATGCLGVKTNTADAMGEVISRVSDFDISETQLRHVLTEFTGQIQQVPSMFSALKHQGRPLYQYARQGVEIERKARDITIFSLELLAFDGQYFKLRVACSKGSYIRNLVEDIGERLGVGAHVTELHRLHTAGFDNHVMVTVDELTAMDLDERRSLLLPIDSAIAYMPQLNLSSLETQHIRQGQILSIDAQAPIGAPIRLYENGHVFIGVGEWSSASELKAKRLLSTESI